MPGGDSSSALADGYGRFPGSGRRCVGDGQPGAGSTPLGRRRFTRRCPRGAARCAGPGPLRGLWMRPCRPRAHGGWPARSSAGLAAAAGSGRALVARQQHQPALRAGQSKARSWGGEHAGECVVPPVGHPYPVGDQVRAVSGQRCQVCCRMDGYVDGGEVPAVVGGLDHDVSVAGIRLRFVSVGARRVFDGAAGDVDGLAGRVPPATPAAVPGHTKVFAPREKTSLGPESGRRAENRVSDIVLARTTRRRQRPGSSGGDCRSPNRRAGTRHGRGGPSA